jgi:hypothetical protein
LNAFNGVPDEAFRVIQKIVALLLKADHGRHGNHLRASNGRFVGFNLLVEIQLCTDRRFPVAAIPEDNYNSTF